MSLPPVEPVNTKKSLPLWVKIGSFLVAALFLVLLVLVLNRSNLQPLRIGDPVPDFTFTDFDGSTTQLSDLRGQRVLLNFWASWCVECQEEAALLEAAWRDAQASGTGLFIGVDYADTEGPAKEFLVTNQVTYLNGPDLRAKISGIFHITGVPETYLIDEEGNLAAVKIGPFSSADEIQVFIQQQ